MEIVAIGSSPCVCVASYRWPAGTPPDADLLRRQFPDSLVHVDGRTVQLEGRLEDHERLAEMLQPARPGRQPPRQRRETRQAFTLHVEDQPAGVVLRQVERQLGLAIEVDEPAIRAAGLSLDGAFRCRSTERISTSCSKRSWHPRVSTSHARTSG